MTNVELYWGLPNTSDTISGGEFETREEAQAAIPGFKRELLNQCATDEERDQILAGDITII